MIDIRTDPTGAPSCSTRRKMAWVAIVSAFAVDATAVATCADGTAAVAAIWASLVLACVSVVVYAASRSVLDRMLVDLTRLVGDRYEQGEK